MHNNNENREELDQLREAEVSAREDARHNPLWLLFVNGYSTLVVFIVHLISLESLLSVALAVAMTVYLYQETDEQAFDGGGMSWVLLSFAIVTPITSSITMAFARRDRALISIGRLRATAIEIYAAHARWDWSFQMYGSSGRTKSSVDWLEHSDHVLQVLLNLLVTLTRYLTLPTSSRARHKVTGFGQKEADKILNVSAQLYEKMMEEFAKLSDTCEKLKAEGLPANEASRIRQWERFMLEDIENMRVIKRYRTPQGLRSFGRMFSMFLPPFYAPYYVQLARDLNSLGIGIAFSVVTSIALTSLFEIVGQMEDPFITSSGLDGIHVYQELLSNLRPRILCMRKHFFPRAPSFEDDAGAIKAPESIRPGPLSGARIYNE